MPSNDEGLARSITRSANGHAFTTIRMFVDRQRAPDAFRAYAYFRWIDDRLDLGGLDRTQAQSFLARQGQLIAAAYRGEAFPVAEPEEEMLLSLVRGDPDPDSGLAEYIRNLMRVMAFDAERRGRLVSSRELAGYTCWLATGVSEALYYFIGGSSAAPRSPARHLAATGAHIAHMLRDTSEDVAHGYFNIPLEVLRRDRISPDEYDSPAYRTWARGRAELARRCLRLGRAYLAQVPSLRCRMACLAYCLRFERCLDRMEHNAFRLLPEEEDRRARAGAWD
jgi:phytoene/squalene synthetase